MVLRFYTSTHYNFNMFKLILMLYFYINNDSELILFRGKNIHTLVFLSDAYIINSTYTNVTYNMFYYQLEYCLHLI